MPVVLMVSGQAVTDLGKGCSVVNAATNVMGEDALRSSDAFKNCFAHQPPDRAASWGHHGG